MLEVTYSDTPLTNYFTVESVTRSILPPKEVNTLEVPARNGAYFSNTRYGIREIQVNILFKATTPTDFMSTMKFLAYCLDMDKPTELTFSDEPNNVYYAILSDKTDVESILTLGKGTLYFLCPDPFAYAVDFKEFTPDIDGYFQVVNAGTTSAYPVFTTTFAGDATFVSYTSPDGIILIGSPKDREKASVKKVQTKFHDGMTTTANWTNAGNILDAGRQNIGAFGIASNGNGIQCTDYGTGTNGNGMWHGVGARADLSSPVHDFTVTANINMSSQDGTSKLDGNQKGRLEIYLFSSNGQKIGKMIMRDSYEHYEFNIPEIYIGNTTFLEDQPKAPAGKKKKQKELIHYTLTANHTVKYLAEKFKISQAKLRDLNGWSDTKTSVSKGSRIKVGSKTITKTIYPAEVGHWNDFFGEFTLSRIGNKWYAEVARIDPETMKKGRKIHRTYYDKSSKYTQEDVAYIVISFLQYETDPVCQLMKVTDIRVTQYNQTTPDTQDSILFEAGDVLEVDLTDSSVTLNGKPFMQNVDVGSTFFPVIDGTTEIKVNTDDTLATHSVRIQERYL